MQDFERFRGAFAVSCLGERPNCSLMLRTPQRSRSGMQYIRRSHRSKVADQPVHRNVGDPNAIDIHHRPNKTRVA